MIKKKPQRRKSIHSGSGVRVDFPGTHGDECSSRKVVDCPDVPALGLLPPSPSSPGPRGPPRSAASSPGIEYEKIILLMLLRLPVALSVASLASGIMYVRSLEYVPVWRPDDVPCRYRVVHFISIRSLMKVACSTSDAVDQPRRTAAVQGCNTSRPNVE
jgi:hypothetical protein